MMVLWRSESGIVKNLREKEREGGGKCPAACWSESTTSSHFGFEFKGSKGHKSNTHRHFNTELVKARSLNHLSGQRGYSGGKA